MFCAAPGENAKELCNGKETVGYLSLTEREPILKQTFAEIIAQNEAIGVRSIFARVKHDGRYSLYDAYTFNDSVFKQKSLSKSETDITLHEFKDPKSKEPISDIRYFILMRPDDTVLNTIGSRAGMSRSRVRSLFVCALLHANHRNIPLKERALTFLDIGESYICGRGVRRNLARAMFWFQKAIDQTENLRARAKGYYNVGRIYHQGRARVAKDYAKAVELYRKAINQQESVGSSEWGRLNLACIFAEGGRGVEKNWATAQVLFRVLMQEATISRVKDAARKHYQSYAEIIMQETKQLQDAYIDARSSVKYQGYTRPEGNLYRVDPLGVDIMLDALDRELKFADVDASLIDQKTPPRDG